MHSVALTHDNEILTWGVNDLGALGREAQRVGTAAGANNNDNETTSDDSDSESVTLNPKEATPTRIDMSSVPSRTIFTQVTASDSATFSLTEDGLVYGWGTFKDENGGLAFSPHVEIQKTPIQIPTLQNIIKLAAGENHVIALRSDGCVLAWGPGERDQLGRRILGRRDHVLLPGLVGVRKGVIDVSAGANHSFAIHRNGKVYSWGVNNSAQTGIASGAGESGVNVRWPTEIPKLVPFGKIICIDGGNEHTVAITGQGECLVWGRFDNFSTGLDVSDLTPSGVIYGYRNEPKILTVPTRLPGIHDASFAAAGAEHNIVITKAGSAYSWGFNNSSQTGHRVDNEVKTPRLINSDSIRDRRLLWASAGSAFSVLAAAK